MSTVDDVDEACLAPSGDRAQVAAMVAEMGENEEDGAVLGSTWIRFTKPTVSERHLREVNMWLEVALAVSRAGGAAKVLSRASKPAGRAA